MGNVSADCLTVLVPCAPGPSSVIVNHKGMLNEKLQQKFNGASPVYTHCGKDPASGHFKAYVKICFPGEDDNVEVEGDPAPQKKAAEHSAAKKALERLEEMYPQGLLANVPVGGGEEGFIVRCLLLSAMPVHQCLMCWNVQDETLAVWV